jgi:hypothetical protein
VTVQISEQYNPERASYNYTAQGKAPTNLLLEKSKKVVEEKKFWENPCKHS